MLLVQMGQREVLVLLVHSVMLVHQVFRACPGRGESLDLQGPKVTEGHSVRKDLREHQETMVQGERLVPLAH